MNLNSGYIQNIKKMRSSHLFGATSDPQNYLGGEDPCNREAQPKPLLTTFAWPGVPPGV